MNPLAKFLGANWTTTLSGVGAAIFGVLTIVAALPYELGEVALIFPPEWKAKIVLWGAIATLILRVWNAVAQKSKEVTGGAVAQDENGAVAKPQPTIPNPPRAAVPHPLRGAPMLLALLLPAPALTGCETLGGLTDCESRRQRAAHLRAAAAAIDCPAPPAVSSYAK